MEILLTAGGKFCLPDAGKLITGPLENCLPWNGRSPYPTAVKTPYRPHASLTHAAPKCPTTGASRKLVGYRDAGERLPRRGPVRRCLLPPLGAGLRRRPHRREHEPWQGQRAPARTRREHGQRDRRGRPAHRDPVLPLPLGHALPGPQLRRVHRGADLQLDLLRRAVGQRGLALRAPPAN